MREHLKYWIVKNTMRISMLLASVIIFVAVYSVIKKDDKSIEMYKIDPDNFSSTTRSYHPADTIKDSIK